MVFIERAAIEKSLNNNINYTFLQYPSTAKLKLSIKFRGVNSGNIMQMTLGDVAS